MGPYCIDMNNMCWSSVYSDGRKDAKLTGYFDKRMRINSKKEVNSEEYMLSYKHLIVTAGVSSADRLNAFWHIPEHSFCFRKQTSAITTRHSSNPGCTTVRAAAILPETHCCLSICIT